MTEEPLPKKVSSRSNVAQATLIFLKLAFASSDYLVKTRVKSLSINTDLLSHFPMKVRLSEGDLKTLTREELCERYCYKLANFASVQVCKVTFLHMHLL